MARGRWSGLKRVRTGLARLPAQLKRDMGAAMAEEAARLADAVRRGAPRDDGALQRSIGAAAGYGPLTSATGAFRTKRTARGDALAREGLLHTVYAGDNTAFYARFVEFGTRPHRAGGMFEGAEHPGATAQPFFFPAIRLRRRAIKRALRAAARAAVKRV